MMSKEYIPYLSPQAEILYPVLEQAILEISSQLENGTEDPGWGNTVF